MIDRAIVSILSVLCSILNTYGQNQHFPDGFDFEMLEVDYNYNNEDIIPGKIYSIEGRLKMKFSIKGAQRIVILKSRPYQNDIESIKYVSARDLKIDNEIIETEYVDVSWGTYFRFDCYKDSLRNELLARFIPVCSNDYVLEADKELLLGQSKIESVCDDFEITVTDVSVIIDNPSEKLANVEIYNMQGQLVYSTKHTEPRITIDKYMLPKGICVLRLRINNNYLTRKLQI